jgi:enamine deaminase RidA (YjgF/YER057c/UK114 family)
MTHLVIQPEGWEKARGYSNGIVASGKTLYIGGQIGWNAQQVFESDDFIGQMELETAGGKVTDLVRLTWYVVDKSEYVARQREVGEAYRRVLGKHFPSMTMVVVSALVEDAALVEIEATAVLPQD